MPERERAIEQRDLPVHLLSTARGLRLSRLRPSDVLEDVRESSSVGGTARFRGHACAHQILHVSFRAANGTLDDAFHLETDLAGEGDDRLDGGCALGLVTYDAAFADVALSYFELRFDEGHELAVEELHDGRQDEPERDERHIDRNEVDRLVEVGRAEVARVHFLAIEHARVSAQR